MITPSNRHPREAGTPWAARQSARDRQQRREGVGAFSAAAREGRSERLREVLRAEVEFTVHAPGGRFVTIGATEVAGRARVAGGAARGQAATVGEHPGVTAWNEDGAPLSSTPGRP
ncbi:hypothetical protein [Streptomyces sp. JHA26]|uniref:hypothetical protein n=1 Tax=Streptomyces sp. JHA26 TaxID=1917143 RepID=UPI00098AC3D7|nr:hypothetical protein [Streptomyces sp. JHA26]